MPTENKLLIIIIIIIIIIITIIIIVNNDLTARPQDLGKGRYVLVERVHWMLRVSTFDKVHLTFLCF